MVDVHEPIDDEAAEMHIWLPADFCGFGLEHAVPIHPIFEPYPLNVKSHDGGMVTVYHSCHFRVH